MKLTKEQLEEIKNQQSQINQTKRVTVNELEKILYEARPALDHGFVRVIDYMGDDTSIVQSARVSYGKGTKQVSTDQGLIKYFIKPESVDTCLVPFPYETLADCTIDVSSPI